MSVAWVPRQESNTARQGLHAPIFRLVINRFHVHAISLSVYLDTGSGNHRRLPSPSLQSHWAKNNTQLFLVSACFVESTAPSSTFNFQEKGNVGPLRMMDNNPNCVQAIWRRMEHPTRSSPPGIG